MSRCRMELCTHWTGDGAVCPCALFGMQPNTPDWVDGVRPGCGDDVAALREGEAMNAREFRIEFTIQAIDDGGDWADVGFGSSGSWDDVNSALYAIQSTIQNRCWETEPGMPSPDELGQEAAPLADLPEDEWRRFHADVTSARRTGTEASDA